MQVTVSHNNNDFDSVAAQYAVTKLYPTARMLLAQPVLGSVREFLSLYRHHLPIVQAKYLDLERVSHVFVVDCQHRERLDHAVQKLIDAGVKYTIFDHHERDPAGLAPQAAPDSVIDPVGAATTLLVEQIKAKKLKLSSFEATLLAIGIYEDTGSLSYQGTTARDADAVAYLLKHKADLSIVNEYVHPKLKEEQLNLLQMLVKGSETFLVAGMRVVLAVAKCEAYLDGLAILTRKLMELESAQIAFSVVLMRDRIHIVGRSDSDALDVREIVRGFGGDGHRGAGSAVVRNIQLGQVSNELAKKIRASVKPEVEARDIMTSPVRTIRSEVTMEEANRIMIRHGIDGLIVLENETITGVVSRRDVDQAMHHKLAHAPVSGFMSRPVISIEPETPLSKIQAIMVKEDIGRLPVLDHEQRLLGLVSRQDVLASLYGMPESGENYRQAIEGHEDDFKRKRRLINIESQLNKLDSETLALFRIIGKTAHDAGLAVYAIGGSVRDLLLGLNHFDLDFVVEGSALTLADCLVSTFPKRFSIVAKHERFQTATLAITGLEQRQIDLSTARSEIYEYPAALPTVEPSMLEQDLLRRDFTINAFALHLNPERFGLLVDHFQGLRDLREHTIRILHPFSFIEDPTRIIRAARFASRLGFSVDKGTAEQAKRAIATGIFDNLGGVRIKNELQLILESPQRLVGLDILARLGGRLRYLDEHLEYGAHERKLLRRAQQLLVHYPVEDEWLVYLGLLLSCLERSRLPHVLARLHLSSEDREKVSDGLNIPERLAERATAKKSLKHSEIFLLLHGSSDIALAIAACLAVPGSSIRRWLRLYLESLRYISTELTGKDLLRLGYLEGPTLGIVLKALLEAKLDGVVNSRSEELQFIQAHGTPQIVN